MFVSRGTALVKKLLIALCSIAIAGSGSFFDST